MIINYGFLFSCAPAFIIENRGILRINLCEGKKHAQKKGNRKSLLFSAKNIVEFSR
jgi:hypothetical protein